VWGAAFVAGLALAAWAQPGAPPPESPQQGAQEKEVCIQNLKTIYQAIQAYQRDHKDLPNWLSDLVPQYLSDVSVLVCPVARRTGKTEEPPLADPRISSSYLFEFCPVPLGTAAPNAPGRTRREWKRRQMGLIGSAVPLVRCRLHNPMLNVAFDGQIFESPAMWEWLFTNRVNAAELTAPRLFADSAGSSAERPRNDTRYPARDPRATPRLINLTKFYNAGLRDSWLGETNSDLAALPVGLQTFAGVDFDVRGIIQLGSKVLTDKRFPAQVRGIPVHEKYKRLHFLHAVGFGDKPDGEQVASYVVHFAENDTRLEIPIVYGRDVRDWHPLPDEPPAAKELTVAWSADHGPRLFMTTWTNLLPDVSIEQIDFVSSHSNPAPFLVAITAE